LASTLSAHRAELYLKRLVVGGFERVFEINRNFRNEGISTVHNPEFTMLEFYQAYTDYLELMDIGEELVSGAAQAVVGTTDVKVGEHAISLKRPFRRITMVDAISAHGGPPAAELRDSAKALAAAKAAGADVAGMSHGAAVVHLFEHFAERSSFSPRSSTTSRSTSRRCRARSPATPGSSTASSCT